MQLFITKIENYNLNKSYIVSPIIFVLKSINTNNKSNYN